MMYQILPVLILVNAALLTVSLRLVFAPAPAQAGE